MKSAASQVLSVLVSLASLTIGASSTPLSQQDLLEMDIEQLMEVSISAASKRDEPIVDAPGVVMVVPRQEMELYGDRDLHQVLQRQTSIYTPHSYAFMDNLACFRGDFPTHQERHTLVLLNGRPIRESALGYGFPAYMGLPLSALDTVEIIRGPGSVLYGTNAFTGVVNLRSRPIPQTDTASASGLAGSYGYCDGTVSLGGRSGALGVVCDLRAVGTHGWPYRLVDALGSYDQGPSPYRMLAMVMHSQYKGLTADIFAVDSEIFTMGAWDLWTNLHNTRTKRFFGNLGYRLDLGQKADLELNATCNVQQDAMSAIGPELVGTNASEILAEATLFVQPTDRLNGLVGYVQEYRGNFRPQPEYFQSIRPYRYWPRALYAQADYSFGTLAKAIAGTQWNESQLGDTGLVWRYGLILTPHPRWTVKLLRGQAFRGPMALESDLWDPRGPMTYTGNPNLKPETIATYDLQVLYADQQTYAALTLFTSRTSQMIVYSFVPPDTITYANAGHQMFAGLEVEVKRSLTTNWHVIASLTHQHNSADPGITPSSAPEEMLKVGTGWTWGDSSASIFWCYLARPPYDPGTLGGNPPPQAADLVNLNIRLDLSEALGLNRARSIATLRIENLLDQDVYHPLAGAGSYPLGPGWTAYMGVETRL